MPIEKRISNLIVINQLENRPDFAHCVAAMVTYGEARIGRECRQRGFVQHFQLAHGFDNRHGPGAAVFAIFDFDG